jgi:hypothetical protein
VPFCLLFRVPKTVLGPYGQRLRSTFALVLWLIWSGFLNDRGRFDFISLERPTDPLLANRGHALKIASGSNPGSQSGSNPEVENGVKTGREICR